MLRDGKGRELNFPWDFAWFTRSTNYYYLNGKIELRDRGKLKLVGWRAKGAKIFFV